MSKKEKGEKVVSFVKEYEARRGREVSLPKGKNVQDEFVPHAVSTQYYLLSGNLIHKKGEWTSQTFHFHQPKSQQRAHEYLQTVMLFSPEITIDQVRNPRQKKYATRITIEGAYTDKERGTPRFEAIMPREGRVSKYEYRFDKPKSRRGHS